MVDVRICRYLYKKVKKTYINLLIIYLKEKRKINKIQTVKYKENRVGNQMYTKDYDRFEIVQTGEDLLFYFMYMYCRVKSILN